MNHLVKIPESWKSCTPCENKKAVETVEEMLGLGLSRELPAGFHPEPETRIITCGGCQKQFLKANFAKHLKEVPYGSQCLISTNWLHKKR